MVVMRRKPLLSAVMLVFSLLAVLPVVEVAKANPIDFFREGPVPANVIAPVITVTSPTTNSVHSNGTLNVELRVTPTKGNNFRAETALLLYRFEGAKQYTLVEYVLPTAINQCDFNITDIPYGRHTVTFIVSVQGAALNKNGLDDYNCHLNTSLSVDFQMYTNPVIKYPTVNATFTNSSVPLTFTIDHSVREIAYSLDGQDKIPTYGNITMTGLSKGQHDVTVYTIDASGYLDASKTLYFNVDYPEPFPIPPFVALTCVIAAVISVSLVFFKRHKPKPA
jgi:hypothetical protein